MRRPIYDSRRLIWKTGVNSCLRSESVWLTAIYITIVVFGIVLW